jgi:D-3-phosphoglycerate dehydrogenase / 2-oxoglutarate reductase
MKATLLVLDDWEGYIANSPCWIELKELIDIRFLTEPISSIPDSELKEVKFIMALRERTALTEQVFIRLPHLKLILQTGGNAPHIDQQAAWKRNISIAIDKNSKAIHTSVPELTMALILGTMHLIPQAQQAMRSGTWPLLTGRTLNRRRLGILGMGTEGSSVAYIAKNAFNMEVVTWARPGSHTKLPADIPGLALEELLHTSDVVSIHLLLSPESSGLLDAERLQSMKKGSVLINTSRGRIVDEEALIGALTNGPLAAAGLDVFVTEPLPHNSPLRKLDNVMLSPHIGWTVEEVFEDFAQTASKQLIQYLQGKLAASDLLLNAL